MYLINTDIVYKALNNQLKIRLSLKCTRHSEIKHFTLTVNEAENLIASLSQAIQEIDKDIQEHIEYVI